MRACEGCRRRKIKCDAATTNTWPCSACVRLKLQCVPPSANYDADAGQPAISYDFGKDEYVVAEEPGLDRSLMGNVPTSQQQQQQHQQQHFQARPLPVQTLSGHGSLNNGPGGYGTSPFLDQPILQDGPYAMPLAAVRDPPGEMARPPLQPSVAFSSPPGPPAASIATPESWQSDPYATDQLTDALAELRVDESGVGMTVSALVNCCHGTRDALLTSGSSLHLPTKENAGRSSAARGVR